MRTWPLFQAATLADMQSEPRWAAFMLTGGQLRQEFIGRVLNAFSVRKEEIMNTRLHDLAFGEDELSLVSRRNVFFSGLPGPLEGGAATAQPLPDHLLDFIKQTLDDESIPLPRRVMAAAQLSALGAPSPEVLAKLADSVRPLDTTSLLAEGEDVMATLLMRLAAAAASYRDGELADLVRHLALDQPGVPMPLRIQAAVMACASATQPSDWAIEVGNVFARCSAISRDRDDIEYTLFALRAMSDVKPEIKSSVARTHARLIGSAKRFASAVAG